jgi:hypothetical protein
MAIGGGRVIARHTDNDDLAREVVHPLVTSNVVADLLIMEQIHGSPQEADGSREYPDDLQSLHADDLPLLHLEAVIDHAQDPLEGITYPGGTRNQGRRRVHPGEDQDPHRINPLRQSTDVRKILPRGLSVTVPTIMSTGLPDENSISHLRLKNPADTLRVESEATSKKQSHAA